MKVEPLNVKFTDQDLATVKEILKMNDCYIVRYLRRRPTVGVKTVTVEDENSPSGTREYKQRVICSGIPYATMIAFKDGNDDLRIGWSRRHTGKTISKANLKGLFDGITRLMHDPKMVEKNAADETKANYEVLLGRFAKDMAEFLTGENFDPIEKVSFSKKHGRITAALRGLKDDIIISKNNTISAASGPIPKDVARDLKWFIPMVEKIYEGKAANVQDAAEAKTTAVAKAENLLPATAGAVS
jgi:hypothetical protein